MEIVVGIISWVIVSLIIGAIGSNRKIGFASSFFLSLLLSPLIGAIFTATSPVVEDNQSKNLEGSKNPASNWSKTSKQCPDCAEFIKLEARVCRFCSYKYSEEEISTDISLAKKRLAEQSNVSKASKFQTMSNPTPGTCDVCGQKLSWIDWKIGEAKRCKKHVEA